MELVLQNGPKGIAKTPNESQRIPDPKESQPAPQGITATSKSFNKEPRVPESHPKETRKCKNVPFPTPLPDTL